MAWTHKETFPPGLLQGTADADPTAGGGLVAPIGSLAIFNGYSYRKTGPDAIDWQRIEPQGGSGISYAPATGAFSINYGDGLADDGAGAAAVRLDDSTLEFSGGVARSVIGATAVFGDSNADTTSNTFVLIQGPAADGALVVTPTVGGTFLVILTCEGNVTAAGENIEIAIYFNNLICDCSTLNRKIANAGDTGSITTQGIVTVAASQTIEGRFRSVGGANVRIAGRQMSVTRLTKA
jgi:hypothetical protein